ncbi:MAG: hypothetical protein ACR2H4_17690 [Pyrinomonadaceae bacterium]
METTDRKNSDEVMKTAERKEYRKPSVQVYGTLSQITQTSPAAPNTNRLDPGSPPQSMRT